MCVCGWLKYDAATISFGFSASLWFSSRITLALLSGVQGMGVARFSRFFYDAGSLAFCIDCSSRTVVSG